MNNRKIKKLCILLAVVAVLIAVSVIAVGASTYVYWEGEWVEVPEGQDSSEFYESLMKQKTAEDTTQEEDKDIFEKIKGTFDSEEVKNAFYSVCSLLAAAVIVIMRNSISKAVVTIKEKLSGFSETTGEKTSELVSAVNSTADEINRLAGELTEVREEVKENAGNNSAHKNALAYTNDAMKALADMFYTTYANSITIPDAAKEVMREKYAAFLKLTSSGNAGE